MFKRDIRIGGYIITPLGQAVFLGLILILIVVVVIAVTSGRGNDTKVSDFVSPAPVAEPTAEPVTPTPATVSVLDTLTTPEPDLPLETPAPAPLDDDAITIRVLGEIRMENNLLKSAYDSEGGTFDFSDMFAQVSGASSNADYTIAYVEGVLSSSTKASDFGASEKTIVTPAAILTALSNAGVDMVALAGDHALDLGWDGLKGTISACQSAGMDYVGATSGTNKVTSTVRSIGGANVAFLNYTVSAGTGASSLKKGIKDAALCSTTNSNCKNDVTAARAAGAEVVVALVNWGKELGANPTSDQRNIAKVLCDAGVDVIIGYGPRVIQPAYWLKSGEKKVLCLCATGTLLCNADTTTDSGTIFEIRITQNNGTYAVTSAAYIPTYVWTYADADGNNRYQALSIGEWINQRPDGMDDNDLSRMLSLWTSIQNLLGSDVASVTAN